MINTRQLMTIVAFGLLSAIFTGFVFANSFELLANQDIPFGNAIARVEMQDPINSVIDDFGTSYGTKILEGNAKLGTLDVLQIPSLEITLQLEDARKVHGDWYQRPSYGQFIELNRDSYGNPVDYLIYTDKSWRTIPYVEEIEVGAEINVVTDKGYTASFVVDSRKALPLDASFVVGKTERRQVVLMIEDTQNSRYYGYSLVPLRNYP